jgi:Fic family protein/DNA-binding XRE family transcriptional regulator
MKTIRQKLEIIQKNLGLSQTKLAERLGVSFVAFNNWWNGKSIPRPGAQEAINHLFLEVTGQKTVEPKELLAKKQVLKEESLKHPNIVSKILDNPDIKSDFVLKLTYHTNSIEGGTLTEPETAAIIFDDVVLPNKSLVEHLEAKNHQAALIYLFDYVAKSKKINQEFILKLHSILMNGIRSDAGQYRRHAVRIVGVNLPTANYIKIPNLIFELMSNINDKKGNDIELVVDIHSRFEQIHPFSDGNGRTGRLLMNAMLLERGLAPAIIQKSQKQFYYKYLFQAQADNKFDQLENFVCDAVINGFRILSRLNIND